MSINGDKLIKLLGLPEWDSAVLSMLTEFKQERVLIKDGIDEFIYIEKYDVMLRFEYTLITSKQIEMADQGNAYFNSITFRENCSLTMPFNLELGDSYQTCINKIQMQEEITERWKVEKIDRFVIEINRGKIVLILSFADSSRQVLKNIVVDLYHVQKDFYIKWKKFIAEV